MFPSPILALVGGSPEFPAAGHAYTLLLSVHIAFAILSLFALPWPLLARKGGPLHVRSGRWFVRLLAGTITTALALLALAAAGYRPHGKGLLLDHAEANPEVFALHLLALFALAITTGAAAWLGVAALRSPTVARPWTRLGLRGLAATAVLVGADALRTARFPLAAACWAVAAADLLLAQDLAGTRHATRKKRHASGLLVAVSGLVETLVVVLVHRRAPDWLEGGRAWLPWVLPALLGAVAILIVRRRLTPRGSDVKTR